MRNFKITQSITDRQDASLGMFFKEVSRIPMASAEEEIELSKRIKDGDIAAIHRLVEANLRFVISVAKQYQNKGLPLVDLIQSGCEGIIEASKRWDESRGFKFISYAVWWIRQSIIQAISSECRTVRVPMNQIVHMNKINKATDKLEQELGRTPSVEEISSETDITSDKINLTLSSINKSLSLDTPFKDEEAGCLLDILPNENSAYADENVVRESISQEIDLVLSKLSNREGDVLRMSFGLGMLPMTLEEISERFGIGAERVRQIQHEAIAKIKEKYSDLLRGLL